jgi:uncharacterized membrane protein YjjP (DUF1212 family)
MSIDDWVTFLHVNWFFKKLLVSVFKEICSQKINPLLFFTLAAFFEVLLMCILFDKLEMKISFYSYKGEGGVGHFDN